MVPHAAPLCLRRKVSGVRAQAYPPSHIESQVTSSRPPQTGRVDAAFRCGVSAPERTPGLSFSALQSATGRPESDTGARPRLRRISRRGKDRVRRGGETDEREIGESAGRLRPCSGLPTFKKPLRVTARSPRARRRYSKPMTGSNAPRGPSVEIVCTPASWRR
jgi:hypothetical protein